ncbi:MAG TPA: hypothetical protein PKY50_04500 [Candidatus Competibacter sp.]|nr:hypothetical protein [Candidatus Competibacter sp.]
MKTLLAALVFGLSASSAALAGPFNMGSQQHPVAVRSSAMAGSGSPAAGLSGFNERDTGYRYEGDGSMVSKTPRAEMTGSATPALHPQGWTGLDAWNS